MPYKFIDHTADVAFEATGRTLEELFEAAARATTETMVRNLDAVEATITKKITIEADTEEKLLFNFLQELIFCKDAEQLLFNRYDMTITKNKKYKLAAVLKGEKINMKKHDLIVDVKAVTYHRFEVTKKKSGWYAFVILDI